MFAQPAGVWHIAMASRACFRMPTIKDAAQIPDGVITIHDLKRHIRSIYNIPSSIVFHLRAWTKRNHGSRKTDVYLKDNEYIKDLEDANGTETLLMIVLRWAESSEQQKSRRAGQKFKLEDRQGRTHKQAEIYKHVCGICRCAECDGTSCNPCDFIHNKRLCRSHQSVNLEVSV